MAALSTAVCGSGALVGCCYPRWYTVPLKAAVLPRADCCCLVWYAVMLSAIVLALGSLSCFELDLSTGLLSKPGGEQVSSRFL